MWLLIDSDDSKVQMLSAREWTHFNLDVWVRDSQKIIQFSISQDDKKKLSDFDSAITRILVYSIHNIQSCVQFEIFFPFHCQSMMVKAFCCFSLEIFKSKMAWVSGVPGVFNLIQKRWNRSEKVNSKVSIMYHWKILTQKHRRRSKSSAYTVVESPVFSYSWEHGNHTWNSWNIYWKLICIWSFIQILVHFDRTCRREQKICHTFPFDSVRIRNIFPHNL